MKIYIVAAYRCKDCGIELRSSYDFGEWVVEIGAKKAPMYWAYDRCKTCEALYVLKHMDDEQDIDTYAGISRSPIP